MNKKVSIIIPTYNYAQFIPETVQAAIDQDYTSLEVVVVDDGSTDNTREVLGSFINDNQIKYFRIENQGPSAARNKGIEESTGDRLLFIDSDDLLQPGAIRELAKTLDENPEASITFGDWLWFDENGKEFRLPHFIPEDPGEHTFTKLAQGDFIGMGSVLVRREILEDVGYFDVELKGTEDYEIWLRLTCEYPMVFTPHLVLKKRMHFNNLSGEENIMGMLQSELLSFEKLIDFCRSRKKDEYIPVLEDHIIEIKRRTAMEKAALGETEESKKLLDEVIAKKGMTLKNAVFRYCPRAGSAILKLYKLIRWKRF